MSIFFIAKKSDYEPKKNNAHFFDFRGESPEKAQECEQSSKKDEFISVENPAFALTTLFFWAIINQITQNLCAIYINRTGIWQSECDLCKSLCDLCKSHYAVKSPSVSGWFKNRKKSHSVLSKTALLYRAICQNRTNSLGDFGKLPSKECCFPKKITKRSCLTVGVMGYVNW